MTMVEIAGELTQIKPRPERSRDPMLSQLMWNSTAKLLRKLPAETAQQTTVFFLRTDRAIPDARFALTGNSSSIFLRPKPDDPRLEIHALGLQFSNPIGQAAGYDKDAKVRDAIFGLGFGFAECGTVTPLPQPGNDGQRIFRLIEDRAVINRMGFNSQGIGCISKRLARRHKRGVIGINLGANKNSADRVSDYVSMLRKIAAVAEYATINVSSPNTPGLRGLQDQESLLRLLSELVEERGRINSRIPLLLKIAPDLDLRALDDIADVATKSGIEGLIISNTTLSRPAGLVSENANQQGGLSGPPLFALSTKVLREMFVRVGRSLVLVGVGGISSGTDVYEKIRAGATLVQLYTALAYEGPSLIPRIKQELLALLERDGFARVTDAIGADVT